MTLIRISGQRSEIDKIIQAITPVIPEILEKQEFNNSVYLNVIEPLQLDARDNLQDWAIIEYCSEWRTTPEIKKYFNISYEQTREICDRLYASTVLARRLFESTSKTKGSAYGYVDRNRLHRCVDCDNFIPKVQVITAENILRDEYRLMSVLWENERENTTNKGCCNLMIDQPGVQNPCQLKLCEKFKAKEGEEWAHRAEKVKK